MYQQLFCFGDKFRTCQVSDCKCMKATSLRAAAKDSVLCLKSILMAFVELNTICSTKQAYFDYSITNRLLRYRSR